MLKYNVTMIKVVLYRIEIPVIVTRASALGAADTFSFDVSLEVEGGFVVVFIVRVGCSVRTLVLVGVGGGGVLVSRVIVFGIREVRHRYRLIVEFERVVVIRQVVSVSVVGVLRDGADGAQVIGVSVGVGVELALLRRHRRGRHGTARLSR